MICSNGEISEQTKNKAPSLSVNGTTGEIVLLHFFDTHLLKARH